MSYASADAAIEARLHAVWNNTLPVAWPNLAFNAATDGPNGFIRPVIRDAEARQADMGDTPRHRYWGVLMVQVFTPKDGGARAGRGHGDTIAAGFRRWSASGAYGTLQFHTPMVEYVGEDGAYCQHNVTVRFYRDTVH